MKLYVPKTYRIEAVPETVDGNVDFALEPQSDFQVGETALRMIDQVWPNREVELFEIDRTSDDDFYLVDFRFVDDGERRAKAFDDLGSYYERSSG